MRKPQGFLLASLVCLPLTGCFVGAFEDPLPPTELSELTPDAPNAVAAWLPVTQTAGATFQHLYRETHAPSETLWVTGSLLETDGSRSARVWSLARSGSTLTSILSTQFTAGSDSRAVTIRAESTSRWLVAGSGTTTGLSSGALWLSTNHGGSWTTLASFRLHATQDTETQDFQIDGAGRYLWLLHAKDSGGIAHSILRVSSDQGATWSTLDDALIEGGAPTDPQALLLPAPTQIVIVGSAFQGGSEKAWIHLSNDSGTTWSEDFFQESAGSAARWQAVALGATSADWSVCGTTVSGTQSATTLRTTSTSGASWSTLQIDRPASGDQDCRSLAFASAHNGWVYTGQRTSPAPFGFLKLTGASPSFLDTLRVPNMNTSQVTQLLWEPWSVGQSFSIGNFTDAWGVSFGVVRKLVTP